MRLSPAWPWPNSADARQFWKSSSLAQVVTTKYRSSPATGRSNWNPSKPGAESTACLRAANRASNSGPAPSGTLIALIFTTDMLTSSCGPPAASA